jgi:hypothetical protein
MLRKFMMNNMFTRNGRLLFGDLANYSNQPGQFVNYFQYEIGPYKDDYNLYFQKMPDAVLYYNSIFLKLWGYLPQDAIRYVETNYMNYPNKKDFLLFLKRELQYRMNGAKNSSSKRMSISNITLDWTNEHLAELKEREKTLTYNQFVKNDLTIIVQNELKQSADQRKDISAEQLANDISKNLQDKIGQLLDNTEEKLMNLADKYETGDIQLANLNLKDKLITLFLTLKNVSGKPNRNNKSGEPLFLKMDLNDIAQILRLHFSNYKGLKIDSIEKRIYEVNNNQKLNDPAVAELTKSLQKFFFN